MKIELHFSILLLTCSLRHTLELGTRNDDVEFNTTFPLQNRQIAIYEIIPPHTSSEARGLVDRIVENKMKKLIDKIATYDPIKCDELKVNNTFISITINNLALKGFSLIRIQKIETDIFGGTMEAVLDIAHITGAIADWKLVGNILFGKGTVRLVVRGITISIKSDVSIYPTRLHNLRIKPSINSAKVTITGVQDNKRVSKIFSQLLTKLIRDELNTHKGLHTLISLIAEQYINKQLE